MKRTYQSPSIETVASNLRHTLLQESDEEKMYVDTDEIIHGPIEDGNKLGNSSSLWDEE